MIVLFGNANSRGSHHHRGQNLEHVTWICRALEVAGLPDVPRAIPEGMDPRVREKVVGEWHSLNVASYVSAKTILLQAILSHMGERMEMAHSVEGRPPFLDHNAVQYINTLPPLVKDEITAKWSFTDKRILRQAVKPFVAEELILRRKLTYNAPPLRRDKRDSTVVPLHEHLKARINQTNVERVGFFKWSFVEETLDRYSYHLNFPADGSLDSGAQLLACSLLMYVLSFIVLQERFHIPTWRGYFSAGYSAIVLSSYNETTRRTAVKIIWCWGGESSGVS
ncbi:hypothetical protein DFH09DRAFT_911687 [Mycena vulgaris]|nr:hypothetical protein DFH09DRAFT_911687 [Mycena vulgaris]